MSEEYRIEQLVRRERYYRDTDQWDQWRDCYHPDSSQTHIDISWFKGEIDEFVQKSQAVKAAGIAPTHIVTPIDTTVRGTRALSISAAQIETRFDHDNVEYDLIAHLRLVSRLTFIPKFGWKIITLEGIYLHDRIVPVFPGVRTTEISMNDIKDLRTSYKCLIWNIERRGREARRDLPGMDRPEHVQNMMAAHQAWVEGLGL